MNFKKRSQNLLLFLGIGIMSINAQNALFIRNKQNQSNFFNLNQIKNFTFKTGNLKITNKNSTSREFSLNEIANLSFGDSLFASISENKSIIRGARLYPNPVVNELHIEFNNYANNVFIDIIDIQSRIIISQNIPYNDGVTLATFTVSNLTNGMYFCRIKTGKRTETIKFIKK